MKQGKHNREKIKVIDRYLVLVIIAILALGIAYAQIASQELTVSGNAETEVQEGVFISKIEYKSNVGADTENSEINYYLGTMMDSKITLGSSSTSTISYDVTVYNNTDKEQLFIKTITDDTDEILYSNTNIGYSVSLEDYVTTIAPKQSLTFTITFAYNGTDTSNPVLESKLNFRFREKPIIELSNEGTTYELENITVGSETEYEFTVKNNNTTYTNGVPMTYTFVTALTEGSPLTAEIYDASGKKVTGDITLAGDGTTAEHTYKLKLTWDSTKTDTAYYNKEYSCNVKLVATPTEAKYLDYEITKSFNVNISTTCNHNYATPEGAGTKYTETAEYNDGTNTAMIPAGFTVSGIGGTCTICGYENPSNEFTIEEGLVVYLIDDKTEAEIEVINWGDETTVANLQKTYDQFVWIPMAQENINDMYMCQSEDGTKSCKITVQNGKAYCTTHSSNLMAGRLYAASTGENFNASLTTQTYTSGSGLREPDTVSGSAGTSYDGSTTYLAQLNGILSTSYATANDFKTDLQSEYNEIVKSVYQNEGFYIGRYETSNMTITNGTSVKVVAGSDNTTNSYISMLPWYIMYAQQKKYAENKGLASSIGSTMIQGAAYDQVMKFVDTDNYDITTYGNVSHDLSAVYQTGGLNYTGTIEYNDVSKNIYDLEGNVATWTTEAYSTGIRFYRGGSIRRWRFT